MLIQQQLKVDNGNYINIYPTSDASQIQRRERVIDYLDGNTLQEILQDTANIYINPNGSYWELKKNLSNQNIVTCGIDDFIFIINDGSSTGLQTTYTFDGGLTWIDNNWTNIADITIGSIVDVKCRKHIVEENLQYQIIIVTQYNNSIALSYLLNIIPYQNNTMENINITQQSSESIICISEFLNKFIVIMNNGYIQVLDNDTNSWTPYNVSLPNNIIKVIFSKDFGKPYGITSDGKICFPNSNTFNNDWTLTTIDSTQSWTYVDICASKFGVAILLGTSNNYYIYYLSYSGILSQEITQTGIIWNKIIGGDNSIFILSNNNTLGIINNIGDIQLITNFIPFNYTDYSLQFLQNKIMGNFEYNDTSNIYLAPLFAYK